MRIIAYLGPEHTNTHVAAQTRFGKAAQYLHAPTVDDVFHLVERQQADYGVVPVENSLEGAVTHTLDRFIDFQHSPVNVVGEIERPIQHYLLVNRGVKLSGILDVYSHPQALAQCRRWLQTHLPHAKEHETLSTADAVNRVHVSTWTQSPDLKTVQEKNRHSQAAIGRPELARGHRLRAIPIPLSRENKTRFIVLGLGQSRRGRKNKTAIVLSLKDKPGALHDALVPFKYHRINLTKIESRPSKRKAWEYLFFIDFEGHVDEPRVTRALQALKRSTTLLRVLGSYPMGT